MKAINNYILLVDSHKPTSCLHSTKGRYRVGAKSEKEAIKLLRNQIKFGSIQVYYQCDDTDITISYKEIVKETFDNNTKTYKYEQPMAATASINKKN